MQFAAKAMLLLGNIRHMLLENTRKCYYQKIYNKKESGKKKSKLNLKQAEGRK